MRGLAGPPVDESRYGLEAQPIGILFVPGGDKKVGAVMLDPVFVDFVQYAPAPPFASGDPSQAPPEVTTAVRQDQGDFVAAIRVAVDTLIGAPA